MESSVYLVIGYFYNWLAVLGFTAGVVYFAHKGIQQHLKDSRRGQMATRIVEEDLAGIR